MISSNWNDSKEEILAIATAHGDAIKLLPKENVVGSAVYGVALANYGHGLLNEDDINIKSKVVDACKIMAYKTKCVHVALGELSVASDALQALLLLPDDLADDARK
jgi:hypothetical protein